MDAERRRQLEQRHDAAAWRGRSAHATRAPLRGLTITGQEIPTVVQRRCDRVYRLTRAGTLELETA